MSKPPFRRTSRANLGPKRTPDGKYLCLADNKTFNTKAEWDRHCSTAHLQPRTSSRHVT